MLIRGLSFVYGALFEYVSFHSIANSLHIGSKTIRCSVLWSARIRFRAYYTINYLNFSAVCGRFTATFHHLSLTTQSNTLNTLNIPFCVSFEQFGPPPVYQHDNDYTHQMYTLYIYSFE